MKILVVLCVARIFFLFFFWLFFIFRILFIPRDKIKHENHIQTERNVKYKRAAHIDNLINKTDACFLCLFLPSHRYWISFLLFLEKNTYFFHIRIGDLPLEINLLLCHMRLPSHCTLRFKKSQNRTVFIAKNESNSPKKKTHNEITFQWKWLNSTSKQQRNR